MRKLMMFATVVSFALLLVGHAMAHTPLCSCWSNGDGTITCEGGFSDGSSAAGVSMYVKDKDGNKVVTGKMDEYSEFTFDKPDGDYTVVFDAGEGHSIKVKGKDIY
ncbi:MAG: hypothetical protein ACQES5_10720 [Thermodesulfobacteriota bacterium]